MAHAKTQRIGYFYSSRKGARSRIFLWLTQRRKGAKSRIFLWLLQRRNAIKQRRIYFGTPVMQFLPALQAAPKQVCFL